MKPQEGNLVSERRRQLRSVAEAYFVGLAKKDFSGDSLR
jgi:hypothetical protein